MPNKVPGPPPAREVLEVKVVIAAKVRKKDLTEGQLHTTSLKNLWIQVM